MNNTEHLLQCASRQGYLDSYKWQSIPFIGAISSIYVAARVALDSLFSDNEIHKSAIQVQAVHVKISEKKHDLSVLFWNSIANIFTAGFFNATRLQAYKPEMKKPPEKESFSIDSLSSSSEEYEIISVCDSSESAGTDTDSDFSDEEEQLLMPKF